MKDHPPTWRSKVSRSAKPGSQNDETIATIVLVRGENMEGQPQWAYALIPADRYMEFKLAEEAGEYNLADYGQVLHIGSGNEPPEDIRRQMTEEYGCNPNFEEEMEAMLIEAMEQLPDLSSLLSDDDTQH